MSKKENRRSIEDCLKKLRTFDCKFNIDWDLMVKTHELQIPRKILANAFMSIEKKEEENAKIYLRAYKNISKGYGFGINIVDLELNEIYSDLRTIFKDLRKRGYFGSYEKNSEFKRASERLGNN